MGYCTKCGREITDIHEGCRFCKTSDRTLSNVEVKQVKKLDEVVRDRYYDNYGNDDYGYSSQNGINTIVKFIILLAIIFIPEGIYIGLFLSICMLIIAKKDYKKFWKNLLKFCIIILVLYSMCSINGIRYSNPSIAVMILKIVQTIFIFFAGRVV